jgi:dihydroorotate dehydrogenase electron transfer subunit
LKPRDHSIGEMHCKPAFSTYTHFRMLDRKVKVKDMRDLGARNYLLTLNATEQAGLTLPGQFVMVKCSGDIDEDPLLRRPFSVFQVHKHPRSGKTTGLDILVKNIGAGTRRLAALKPGDDVFVLGPQGRGFKLASEMKSRKHVPCLVAGGVGIAAFYLLARHFIKERKISPVLFYGGRSEADLVLREYFEQLGMETIYTTEDGSLGEKGLVTRPLERYLEGHSGADLSVYACGPWAMMKSAHEVSMRHDVSCEVSLEARMGCSLGACMGCVIRAWDDQGEEQYLRVCLEGPVMNSRTVDWDTPPL